MTENLRSDLVPDYAPFYCEENIYRLDQHPALGSCVRHVVFISNARKTCALWAQRLSSDPQEPVLWDYHVVLLTSGDESGVSIWDLDSCHNPPVAAALWLTSTFPHAGALQPRYEPTFRVVDSATFQTIFSTDRSHMRDESGAYRVAPPAWTAPFKADLGMNLSRFTDMTDGFVGDRLDFAAFQRLLTDMGTCD